MSGLEPMHDPASEPPPGLPRGVELALAVFGVLALWPLLLLVALAVRFSSPGPILFRQTRIGRHGRPFTLLKFRTMSYRPPSTKSTAEGSRVTASGDARVTPVGKLLRASKLDELPELLNIVRGEMSFVGPRPEVPDLVDLEDPLWRFVLRARPGLTDPVTLRLREEERLLADLRRRLGGELEEIYRRHLQPFKLRGYADALRERSVAGDIAVIAATLLAIVDPGSVHAPLVHEILEAKPCEEEKHA